MQGARYQSALCKFLIVCSLSFVIGQYNVIRLSSANFEGRTQAATGQTTGTWFVLFTSSVEPSLQPLTEAWSQMAASYEGEALPVFLAVVDIAEDHYLAERFSVSAVPTFLLFRNRKMYKYEGVDTGLDALKHFSQEGYLHSPALEVPPEPSPIDAAVKAVKANTKLALGAAAMVCLVVTFALLFRENKMGGSSREAYARRAEAIVKKGSKES